MGSSAIRYNVAAKAKRPGIVQIANGLKNIPVCEDYEKMVSGMLYDPFQQPLVEGRHRARGLAHEYNNIDPRTIPAEEAGNVRFKLLENMLGKVGKGTFIEPPFYPDYGCNISIGQDTFINWNMTVLDTSIVVIGDRVMFGPNVSLLTAGHETSVLSRQKLVEFGHPIFIGNDCWIGSNVQILPGVTIGEGCTIGAGAIVTRDIPPYSVAVGNPARVVKKLPTVEEEKNDPNNPYNQIDGRSSMF